MKIYTKTGDAGDTGLFGGGRVPKAHPRVQAYGSVDALRACYLPGATMKAATLHVARTICWRAERDVIAMSRSDPLPPIVLIYLNRLSDLLFVLARVATRRAGAAEVTW